MFILVARNRILCALSPLFLILAACNVSSPAEDFSSMPSAAITPYLTPTQALSPATQVEDENATPSASPTQLAHIVVANDTLLGIAQRYGVSLDALLAVNPGVNPSLLSLGMEVHLPQGEQGVTTGLATPTALPLNTKDVDCYATAAAELWCFFPVENKEDAAVENLAASIQLLSSAGELLHSAETTASLNILQPGESLPLVAYWHDAPSGWTSAQGQLLSAYVVIEQEARYLPVELSNVDIDISPTGLSAHIRAELESGLATEASLVWVLAVAYDAQDNVLGLRRWEGTGEDTEIDFWVYSLGGAIQRVDLLLEARP